MNKEKCKSCYLGEHYDKKDEKRIWDFGDCSCLCHQQANPMNPKIQKIEEEFEREFEGLTYSTAEHHDARKEVKQFYRTQIEELLKGLIPEKDIPRLGSENKTMKEKITIEELSKIIAETTFEAQLNFWQKASDFQKGLIKNLKEKGYIIPISPQSKENN